MIITMRWAGRLDLGRRRKVRGMVIDQTGMVKMWCDIGHHYHFNINASTRHHTNYIESDWQKWWRIGFGHLEWYEFYLPLDEPAFENGIRPIAPIYSRGWVKNRSHIVNSVRLLLIFIIALDGKALSSESKNNQYNSILQYSHHHTKQLLGV